MWRLSVLVLGLRALAAAEATLPDLAPSVRTLFPLGGRAGETAEVEIRGRNLENAREIVFARGDIRAEILEADFFLLKARVAVGPRVPVGIHDYRLRTPRGTYVGVFHVASLASEREKEPNNEPSQAQRVRLPVILDGNAGAGDYDVFRFHAEAGETVIFDLTATRASSRLDGTLAVLDERGNELEFVDDAYIHKDAFLAFRAPANGDYLLRVAAAGGGGSRDGSYRVAAGVLPYASRVLPAGLRRGSTGELRLAGFNLRGVDRVVLGDGLATGTVSIAGDDAVTVRIDTPATIEPGRHMLRVFSEGMEGPVGLPVVVSDLEEKLALPARARAEPQAIEAPVAVTGTLDRRKRSHFFALEARAGQRLAFEVDAMKLGYLVDPVLGVYTMEGELAAWDDDRLQQNGAEPPNLDPYLVHRFEKAGRYIVMIRDSAERGDPNYVYRLAVYPVEPDFELKALTPAITLYRGRTVELLARVRRAGGWSTPVEVWVDNLPPGVASEKRTAEPKPTIVVDNCALQRRLDGTNVLLPLRAAPDAVPGEYRLKLKARGEMDGRTVEHAAEILFRWESAGKVTGPTAEQQLLATVTELPPVVLEAPESLAVKPGETARLRVLVKRFSGTPETMTLEPDRPVPGVEWSNNVVEAGASQVEVRVTASKQVKAGVFRLRAGGALSPPIRLETSGTEEGER